MTILRLSAALSIALAAAGISVAWGESTVSTWIDSEGVRHFSQFPPVEDVQQLETIRLQNPPSAVSLEERLESLRAVSRDLELARQQRELERRQQVDKTVAPEQPTQSNEPEYDAGSRMLPYPFFVPYPPYQNYPPRPPYRPAPRRHKPEPKAYEQAPHTGMGRP
ncbi:MAG: DUF4124 domain-containing protein [Gammaproteobacteria bacterium]|nr:DUF4124 domain-containing protein [Gammaproteobacteria bacterium]